MGKSSLISVVGMSLIVSILVLKLNSNSMANLSSVVNMFDQYQARLIANTGIEIYLEKLYADTTLINTTSQKNNLFHGNYFVKLDGTIPQVRVTSTAEFNNVPHTSVAEAYLEPITFPDLPAGMYITSNALTSAKLTGDMDINGSNHNPDGTLKADGKPAVFGIGVDSEDDKTSVFDNLNKPDRVKGLVESEEIGYPSVEVTNLGEDWAKIYQYLANSADQTFIGNIPSGTNLGTLSNPKITLINADASDSKSISISQTTGAGIMVINGDVNFAGNFKYQGIIICYKNTILSFSTQGTNEIIGGLIVAGKLVEIKTTGTMNIKYSADTIAAVKANLKSNGYKILSWYE
jgi:hypothetical protein